MRLVRGWAWILLVVVTVSASAAPLAPPAGFPPGLQVTDLVVGQGPVVGRGDIVAVHYTGVLYDPSAPDGHGRKFDSSSERSGEPLVFRLGRGSVIAGWDAGISGMQRGGQRRLIIPPSLAYGNRSVGKKVPANATLVFEVNLVSLQVMD